MDSSEKGSVVLPLEIESELHAVADPQCLGGWNRDSRLDLPFLEEHSRRECRLQGQLHANVALALLDGRLAATRLHEHAAPVLAIRRTSRHGDHHAYDLALPGLEHEAAREDAEERGERRLPRSRAVQEVHAQYTGSIGDRVPESD